MKLSRSLLSAALGAAVVTLVGCNKATVAEKPVAPADAVADIAADAVEAAPGEFFDLGDELAGQPLAAAVDPARALVTVDGAVLTYGDADTMARRHAEAQGVPAMQLDAFMAQMGPMKRAQMVDQFVVSTLLKNEAAARKIEADDSTVNEVISNLTSRLPPGMTLEQALEDVGVSVEKLRQDVREQETLRSLYVMETESIAPASEAEVAAYYDEHPEQFVTGEEVTARHILIGAPQDDEEQRSAAKARATELLQELKDGGDFAALAAANSDCGSKEQGGNLGSFGRGAMVPPFEKVAFALKLNELSEVVETQFGYHIIEVTEKSEGGKTPLEEVREELTEQLTGEKRSEAFEKLIEELRAKATIIHDEPDTIEEAAEEAATEVADAVEAVVEVADAVATEAAAKAAEAVEAVAEAADAVATEAAAKAAEAVEAVAEAADTVATEAAAKAAEAVEAVVE